MLSRKKIKTLMPQCIQVFLAGLFKIYRKSRNGLGIILYPLEKGLFAVFISIFPESSWGYEKILDLVYRHRHRELIKNTGLFIHYFKIYKKLNPECILKWRVKACICYLMLHDTENLQETMHDYVQTQRKLLKQKQLDELNIRIITENVFEYYNVHAYLDTHIKARQLGWTPQYNIIQLLRPGMPVFNPIMLEYWKQYITVIDDPEVIQQLTPLRKYLELDMSLAATLRDKTCYIEHAKCIVQKEWEKEGRKPLMQLTDEDRAFGKEQLLKMGIPEDAWFVSFHVRDAGYKTGSYLSKETYDSYRNANIESYRLAMEEVIKRGGYVIRVGDPNMKPFEGMDGYFDYAHSEFRSNRMDIFLFSQCCCFVGVSSGPVLTPILFGTPVVMTNFVPMSGRPHAGNCLFIPKLLWLKDEQRYAAFHEVLSSDLGRIFTSQGYDERNIELVDNTPDEIKDVVVEMLDQLDNNMVYSDTDEKRQNQITGFYQKYSGYGDMGRMGNAFVDKYAKQGLL